VKCKWCVVDLGLKSLHLRRVGKNDYRGSVIPIFVSTITGVWLTGGSHGNVRRAGTDKFLFLMTMTSLDAATYTA